MAPGVPLSTPVLASNVNPVGNLPASLSFGLGNPVAVTVKLPALPTTNVALLALVIAGAWSTESVKLWLAAVPMLLFAVNVRV